MNEPIEIQFYYKNWKGELSLRRVNPLFVWYGATEYHPVYQLLLCAYDLEKQANRDFAIDDIQDPVPNIIKEMIKEFNRL